MPSSANRVADGHMSRRDLILGPMPGDADPASVIAAGPWCFCDREEAFPDWETRFSMAPDPFVDRAGEDSAIREAGALAADMIMPLARQLSPSADSLPAAYWETLLVPYAINLAKQIVDRWHRVRQMVQSLGGEHIRVVLLPDSSRFVFGDDADVILHGALNPVWNHWLFSRLLERVLPDTWTAEYASPVTEDWGAVGEGDPRGLRARMKDVARSLLLSLPFPRMKGMSMKETLAFSRALCHASRQPDHTRSLSLFSSQALGITVDLPLEPLALFVAMLPRSIENLVHPSSIRPMRVPRVRAASILLYEDAAYRQKIARWRGAGGRLLMVQHGGNYGQMQRISAMELVEYTQHAFVTWGWTTYRSAFGEQAGEGNFTPLPYPQLTRLAERRQRQSDDMIYVGTEMPTTCYQLDSHPMPSQVIAYRADKLRFFAKLPEAMISQTLYRPYFPVPGTLEDADWVMDRVPGLRRCTGSLEGQILASRLLVLDHHGTTLLEAMAANIPTVCFWNRESWPVTDDFDALLQKMREAGIWHPDPEDAARQTAAVWDDPDSWWQSPAVQDVRKEFLHAYARTEGPAQEAWLAFLRAL